MMMVTSVDSVRNLPTLALFGSALIFMFILSALIFLIPCALVSAELGSTWTKRGGIYIWVKEAFGDRIGLFAVWLQWSENVIWFPALLAFIAASFAYLINPALAQHKVFLITLIVSVFWLVTLANWFGLHISAIVSNVCGILGLILPLCIIMLLGLFWVLCHHPLQIHFSTSTIIPHLSQMNTWRALTGIMISFCGIELTTVHAGYVKDPQKNYPKALGYAVILMIVTMLLAALTLAVIIPVNKISLVAGVMQVFSLSFSAYHLSWLVKPLAIMMVLGGLGQLSNWIIAPTYGLLMAAQDGNLPAKMKKTNQHGAPINLLFYQAVLVTILSFSFTLIPSINGAFWLLTALTAQQYMLMYIIMFAAGIFLRYKQPEKVRPYKIPGKRNIGAWCVSIIGTLAAAFTIFVSFVPIDLVHVGALWRYQLTMIIALIILITPPFILFKYRN
jgi:amino acid transporter